LASQAHWPLEHSVPGPQVMPLPHSHWPLALHWLESMGLQVEHIPPPVPQAPTELPGWHWLSEQHPWHDVPSQTQWPLAQC
jgi:hypothetical protein